MEHLPGDCISAILSETSPEDVLKLSAVSSTFHSAAQSEFIWDKFLPSGHRDVVSRSVEPVKCSTKKELFRRLCDPLLIDNGRKSFMLERSTGRISYVLSARELSITWSDDPMYWVWKFMPELRFREAVELTTIHWLEIEGCIRTKDLSINTLYGAYLIVRILGRAYGLDVMPSEIAIEIGSRVLCSGLASLHSPNGRKLDMESRTYGNRTEKVKEEDVRVPTLRADGWMEIELGQFYINGGRQSNEEEIKMSLKEIKGYQLKGGLMVEGIEIRPI